MQRDVIVGAGLLIAAIAVAVVLLVQDAHRLAVVTPEPAPAPAPVIVAPPQPPKITTPQIIPPAPVVVAPQKPASAPAVEKWTPAARGRRGPDPAPAAPITLPIARDALGRVGFDPAADDVYIAAINDTDLAPNERKNLIEDLNETGFTDPRNLTRNDLPVIEYRLAMIEQIGPDAIDEINAAAFQEAYKDLVNMRARLIGQ